MSEAYRVIFDGAQDVVTIAEGLAKAHEARIVHRDLKPENIVISDDGYAKDARGRYDAPRNIVEQVRDGDEPPASTPL